MTENLLIANSAADARAVEAVEQHHAELVGALTARSEALVTAARAGRSEESTRARQALVDWARGELVPHVLAEEGSIHRAGQEVAEARLLVEAMLAENAVLVALVDELDRTEDAVAAAAVARALRTLVEVHLAKEDDQLVPLLAATPGVSVAELVAGAPDLLGASASEGQAGHGGHGGASCGCNETDEEVPELDARIIPHAIRHATIFGALDAVRPGAGMVLVAPHDPLPLLAQIEQREPGVFSVDYLERGPEAWRLLLQRSAG